MSIIRFMLIKTGQQLRLSQILRCPNKIEKKVSYTEKMLFHEGCQKYAFI